MKKIFTFVALFTCLILQAQTPFITPVTYRGAFAPAPTAMWTAGWTNWDPENTNYGLTTDSTISGTITSNLTLSGTKKYLLSGLVYVDSLVTLTINAGCIIKGNAAVANSSLIVTRGGKIRALGTSTKPIVFTSSQPVGSRNKGDWGGVILLGRAHYNGAGGQAYIEGIAANRDSQFGGGFNPDDNDSSGVMQYVRIEFGGYIFAQNAEINGLTLGAVGRKTVINNIQVSFVNDDAFEWFGGTVNCRYLVAYRCLDDNWDTDNGFSGAVQFCLGVRDPNISDNPSISTSEGFESDNAPGNGITGTQYGNGKPYTTAIFSNITEIGPLRGNTGATIATGFRRGARIRRFSHLRIVNSILMDHPTGVMIDGVTCAALASGSYLSPVSNSSPGNLVFKNNILAGNRDRVTETNVVGFDVAGWFNSNRNDSISGTSGLLINPYNFTAGDYRPSTGSAALRNFNFNDSAFYYIDTTGNLSTLIACPATVATPAVIVGRNVACSYIGSGDTARYYLSSKSNLGVLRYEWTVPSGVTIVSGQGTDTLIVTYNNTFPASGAISVRCQSYCGAYSAARSFTVSKGIPGTAGIISGPTFICDFITNGDSATYTVPALLFATSYLWTAPTGATIVDGQGTRTIKVLFDNTFTTGSISVRGVAPCGQSAASRTLALSKLSAAPGLISGKKISCGFLNTPLIYSVANVSNASSYIWTVPTGATISGPSNGSSIEVIYSTPTAGSITVKSVTSCGISAARTQAITRVGTPVSITGDVVVCFTGNDYTYTVNDTLNNMDSATYTWTVPTGSSITSGQGTSSITVAYDPAFLAGNITVRANGCGTYGSTRSLSITKDPGCSGSRFAKAIATVTPEKLVVSPNPSKGNFTVYFASKTNAEKGTIQISNAFGQVVSQRMVPLTNGIMNEQITDSKLVPGVYFVKCTIGSAIKITKIVVQ